MPPKRNERSKEHGRPSPRDDTLGRFGGLSLSTPAAPTYNSANVGNAPSPPKPSIMAPMSKSEPGVPVEWCLMCHDTENLTVDCPNPNGRSAREVVKEQFPTWYSHVGTVGKFQDSADEMKGAPASVQFLLYHFFELYTSFMFYIEWVNKRDAFLLEFTTLVMVDKSATEEAWFKRWYTEHCDAAHKLIIDLDYMMRSIFNDIVGQGLGQVSKTTLRLPGVRARIINMIFEAGRRDELSEDARQKAYQDVTGILNTYREKADALNKDWTARFTGNSEAVYDAIVKSGYRLDVELNLSKGADGWLPELSFPAPVPEGLSMGDTQPKAWAAELSFRGRPS